MGDPITKEDVANTIELVKVMQRGKTQRLAIICATIVICFVTACWAAVRITAQPPWVVISTAVLSLAGPSPLFWFMLYRHRRYTQDRSARLAALEREHDPARTSSGLKPTGEHPLESML